MSGASRPVGFVGLGAMGGRMAVRLLDAGHDLVVHDPAEEAVAALRERAPGRVAAPGSAAGVAAAAEIALVSLPSPQIVAAVAKEMAASGSLATLVDLSTTGPEASVAIGAELAAAGVAMVDAPVSGGPPGAEAGRLTTMVAGAAPAIEAVRPLLETFATNVFVVGEEVGQGQLAKVINNLLSAAALAISAEGLALGVKSGLDAGVLLEVLNVSSGRNSATQDKFPAVLSGGYDYGFRLQLMEKDVAFCLDAADAAGVPSPVGDVVGERLRAALAAAGSEADCTELVRAVEAAAGVEIR